MTAIRLFDRIKETSTTTGTGNFTLLGAVTGYRTFYPTLLLNQITYYCIENPGTNEWEVGIGEVLNDTTFARNTVIASNTAAKVSFSSGTKNVFCTAPADHLPLLDPGLTQGRLTLTTGTPITTSDVTGATVVYFCPYKGNRITLHDGDRWISYSFSEIALALGTVTSGLPYDIFAYYNSSSKSVDTEKLAWTNGTTRATALTTQDNIYVKTGDTTRKYLGTIYTSSTTATESSITKRYVWNYYNRCRTHMYVSEATDSWTYTSTSYQQVRASTANKCEFVIGVIEDEVEAEACNQASNSGTAFQIGSGIGLDSTSTNHAQIHNGSGAVANVSGAATANYKGYPAVGYHALNWLEASGVSTGTTTWYGDAGSTFFSTGMSVSLMA